MFKSYLLCLTAAGPWTSYSSFHGSQAKEHLSHCLVVRTKRVQTSSIFQRTPDVSEASVHISHDTDRDSSFRSHSVIVMHSVHPSASRV